ncbi:MAG: hypothetical protein JWM25_819 [Thermoleophilia bacterium]|nr:hypothetical protein [Thermoleophilia bacterium]MCZ4496236.1 hypothetical protein [Thermoleophilia bacterium]
MYRFSRAIYLETRELITGETPDEVTEGRRRVLAACENTMERLAKDSRYFADPAKSLFSDIRYHYPIREQERLFHVVTSYVAAALQFLEKEQERAVTEGAMLRCRAQTRKGKACQRTPLPESHFCPSHQHLASIVA